jgi:hypothetical protein
MALARTRPRGFRLRQTEQSFARRNEAPRVERLVCRRPSPRCRRWRDTGPLSPGRFVQGSPRSADSSVGRPRTERLQRDGPTASFLEPSSKPPPSPVRQGGPSILVNGRRRGRPGRSPPSPAKRSAPSGVANDIAPRGTTQGHTESEARRPLAREATSATTTACSLRTMPKVDDAQAEHKRRCRPRFSVQTGSRRAFRTRSDTPLAKTAQSRRGLLGGTCAGSRVFLLQPVGALDAAKASTRPHEEGPRFASRRRGQF